MEQTNNRYSAKKSRFTRIIAQKRGIRIGHPALLFHMINHLRLQLYSRIFKVCTDGNDYLLLEELSPGQPSSKISSQSAIVFVEVAILKDGIISKNCKTSGTELS